MNDCIRDYDHNINHNLLPEGVRIGGFAYILQGYYGRMWIDTLHVCDIAADKNWVLKAESFNTRRSDLVNSIIDKYNTDVLDLLRKDKERSLDIVDQAVEKLFGINQSESVEND